MSLHFDPLLCPVSAAAVQTINTVLLSHALTQ